MESQSLLEKAYTIIRSKILLLEYEVGDVLSICRIAEELGMSRTPISHAISRLELEGLVTTIKKGGTIVRQISPKKAVDNLELIYCYRMYTVRDKIILSSYTSYKHNSHLKFTSGANFM